ncbi:DExH-box ATP-dependent RNA helicase DExH14 isoform X1 [Physcomitrium patens]|uniref:RNA helicase n=1 Tax=Physcomitrium patens TaxID=3218 RepID=A0A2K1L0X0_PHYPA|nr:DExH-box ATP-dependent RNA helicase DExH14-like isoform X1 [Physcomitrium patens]PNR59665.1 hypothetical protein PHYPA_002457 [Physcomitrium patens]|eukprot:XP_024368754.1 DExH-box ATP-dependent RNA helicase DExH14-like isoform X1 [Physcomitrella patens]
MAIIQKSRLSTVVRSIGNPGTVLDVDKLYLERKRILEQRRQSRNGVAAVGSSELARRLVPSWDEAPAKIRHAYEQFLVAVKELIDGEVPPDELQQSASLIYDSIHDLDGASSGPVYNQKREKLANIFGQTFPKDQLLKVADLANQIHVWQLASNVNQKSSSKKPGNILDEFGSNLSFQVPAASSDEFEDISDDDEDDWDDLGINSSLEDTAIVASSAVSQQTDGSASMPHKGEWPSSTSNGVGGITLRWYYEACEQASHGQFSGSELAMALYRVLDSERSEDEIAGELFDLVGDGGFELIQELLQHRKEIVELVHKAISICKSDKASSGPTPRMPSYGTQVSVHSDLDKQLDKLRKKEEKKQAKRVANGDSDAALEWLSGLGGFYALVEASEKGSGVIDGLVGKGDDTLLTGAILPQGSIRKVFKGYEEVRVPAIVTAALKPNEKLIKIGELPNFAQLAFEGYKTLNRIQSRIFPTAFNSNENILVCAPTGAGKTNIAMISVLHEIGQNMKYGVLQKNDFKIVYVAPMKALAAEMTQAFSRRLAALDVVVKELTGDMQLTKRELEETQMIVTTPEKWDVITRKSSDMALATLVKLLIIDEVHLLNDDRGPVIETLVARTLRQVESTQSMIRIVGLSATLPNYLEVAQFLRVNAETGLFYFDASYRPVPLSQQYIGITEQNFVLRNQLMNEVCYTKVMEAIKRGQQAMVFVHSRKDTVKSARSLVEIAQRNNQLSLLTDVSELPLYGMMKKEVTKSRNRELVELFGSAFGVHHAGMLRSDRNLTERLFSEGMIKVLVCTATLAWGVNLPAHMVVIKGTQLYDPKAGGWRELGMLDVMQIFGRAGRPQFDTSGEGIIITTHNKLSHYLRLLTHQLPIESQFVTSLKDNLNAEVVLGTVTNVKEAIAWLGYTYLFVRMLKNPLVYGMSWEEAVMDPGLLAKRKALITDAARELDKAKMMRFDEKSGNLYVTDLGRVASHFYIQYTSVETYNEMLKRHMNEAELIHMVAHSSEFENIMVREEEQQELAQLVRSHCPFEVKGGPEDKYGKINILIQVYLSRGFVDGFSLVADSSYINASLGRIMRALFEICLRRSWVTMTTLLLEFCKAVDRRVWPHQHPLRQFDAILSSDILYKLESRDATMERLYNMDDKQIGELIRHPHGGKLVVQCLRYFPRVELSANISPITRTVLQVALTITIPDDFDWKDKVHGLSERWWIWVEDSDNEHIYHSELLSMSRKTVKEKKIILSFTIPIFEPLPSQYYIRAISDKWLHAEALHTVSFQHLILPEQHPPHTELLDLRPLPLAALGNKEYEKLYNFTHFNPIQTQAFHTLYHTDNNVLLGAPTGSGKTISSELAIMRLFNTYPDMKVIYIAPLKALVRERMDGWGKGFAHALNKKLVELTGDFTPDMRALLAADIIISTPEKWDGISRNWHNRSYVTKVGLMVIDEIHLLGADRGPILEVIVSRMRYISSQTGAPVRFIGLSTALANARDLANWLGIEEVGLYNFKPSVRPVPLEVHIQGYPGKFYCPRMNSMNKPTYAAITTHSPFKPVLIFVSSRRQTRLTALDLIQYASADERPRQFVNMTDDEMDMVLSQVQDENLKHTLQFGVGLHHAGLNDRDRSLVEELFTNTKIQILVCTSTLAWGVNLPAHLVVIKGTEFFDGKTKRYVDFPITDVLQMMGRAGRPQYDQHGKAVILVHDPKKSFYKKFLYEPFPVESMLTHHLHDHFNAEVVAGTISSKQDAIDYLTWTYLFRRLVKNPSFYDLGDTTSASINAYLSGLVNSTLQALEDGGCLRVNEDDTVEPLVMGSIASQYYLHYTTVALFSANIRADTSLEALLQVLSGAAEFDELPVRHNEDKVNEGLAKEVRWPVDMRALDDPHVKTNLLLQAHFSRIDLPVSDYVTDTKSVLDQSIRVLQAMVDVAANGGWLETALSTMHLLQMIMQGLWWEKDDRLALKMLPYVNSDVLSVFKDRGIVSGNDLLSSTADQVRGALRTVIGPPQVTEFLNVWMRLPRTEVKWKLEPSGGDKSKEWVLRVEVSRRVLKRMPNARAYVPHFPKVKDEGWWLVAGNPKTREVYALKRVTFLEHLRSNLVLPKHLKPESEPIKLYLVSDCYVGLDQEFEIRRAC